MNDINILSRISSTHFQTVRHSSRSVSATPVCIAGDAKDGPVIAWDALMQVIHAGLRRKWSSSCLKQRRGVRVSHTNRLVFANEDQPPQKDRSCAEKPPNGARRAPL
ncbi:hypothetical protein [Neorhizobium sp. JUb45]|uniref:hypothetical protein n=1 Tax=unclassified Neorhizobium TaxID=2629175 RepID=UPI001047A014|nr:hypothetical protein [Neorhizobium sp. JUb45]